MPETNSMFVPFFQNTNNTFESSNNFGSNTDVIGTTSVSKSNTTAGFFDLSSASTGTNNGFN